jgi:alpha-glucosidase
MGRQRGWDKQGTGLPEDAPDAAHVPFDRLRDPDGIAFWPAYKGRDGCRTPMPWRGDDAQAGFSAAEPWLPLDPRHRALAVDRQEGDAASMLAFTRTWLAIRKARPALQRPGIVFADDAPEGLLDFQRGGGAARLVFNLGLAEVRLPADGWALAFAQGAWQEGEMLCLPAGAAALLERAGT